MTTEPPVTIQQPVVVTVISEHGSQVLKTPIGQGQENQWEEGKVLSHPKRERKML